MISHGWVLCLVSVAGMQAANLDGSSAVVPEVRQPVLEEASSDLFPSPGEERSNVRLTSRGKTWYAHVPVNHEGDVELRFVPPPDNLVLVGSGEPLAFEAGEDGTVRFSVPQTKRMTPETVVAATWHLERWEKDIQRMEENASEMPAEPILFVGSSSIRGWDLARYFPDLPVVNHGFGGSQYFDALCYANRIITPFRARAVVLYDGDNDIASGKSPEWVRADLEALVRTIRHVHPEVPIIVLSIKTSLSRWDMHEEMEEANALMARFAADTDGVTFLDVNSPLHDTEGRPDDRYFKQDRLHLNDEGYAVWAELLRPLLPAIARDSQ